MEAGGFLSFYFSFPPHISIFSKGGSMKNHGSEIPSSINQYLAWFLFCYIGDLCMCEWFAFPPTLSTVLAPFSDNENTNQRDHITPNIPVVH